MLMDFCRFICTFEKYILGWIEKLRYWAGYHVLIQIDNGNVNGFP